MYNLYSAGRDPRYFKDPDVFNPDRWQEEGGIATRFASLPFGFGPRACYGMHKCVSKANAD